MPPFTGVAVKIIWLPAQEGLVPDEITKETEGVNTVLTVIVIGALVPTVELAQTALEERIQVSTSPFANEVVVKVVLLVPTLPPFICH